MSDDNVVGIKKFDEELRIVYGEVYSPNVPDSQGDYMTPVEIRKMAHRFLASKRLDSVDENHNHKPTGSYVVESFIARKADPDFIPESWVVGIHIPEDAVWAKVKSGELNGFSMEGLVRQQPGVLEIEVPEVIIGKTSEDKGHSHDFEVELDDSGQIKSGRTNVVNGHYHEIRRGTATEVAVSDFDGAVIKDSHTHRFSFVEMIAGSGVGGVR